MKMTGFKLLIILSLIGCANSNADTPIAPNYEQMKITISFGQTKLTATLYDNPTSRDLIAQMPITTELEDYAGNEKIFYPDRKSTRYGAPAGYQPSTGDITYYAPWGDVAIFYQDFSHAPGLISLGKIEDNGIELLKNVGNQLVTFELAE